jgi:hypothetical protein
VIHPAASVTSMWPPLTENPVTTPPWPPRRPTAPQARSMSSQVPSSADPDPEPEPTEDDAEPVPDPPGASPAEADP